MSFRRILVAATAAFLAWALTGPRAAARDLNVALSAEIRSNLPGGNRDANTDTVLQHIVEGLVGYAEDGTVKPLLARSVSVSTDGRRYSFVLRDDVRFQDGTPMTANDVVWNWERYMRKETGWVCRRDFDGSQFVEVTRVWAPDPSTVEVDLAAPTAILLQLMARPECAGTGIISRSSFATDGSFVAPIGTGPFKWVEWRRGEYIRLERYDDYRSTANTGAPDGMVGAKRPLIDGIKFSFIPDAATIQAGLNSGALDLAQITADLIPDFKQNPEIDLQVVRNFGKNLFYMQTRDGVLKNVLVRRALAEALDLDQLVDGASNGTGRANPAMMPMGSPYYSAEQARRVPFDLAKAKQDLAAAHYKGEPITIIANRRGTVPSYPAAIIAQAMWQQAGLNVQIEVLDFATQVDRRRSGKYQIISQSVAVQFDPALMETFFTGDKDRDRSLMWDDPKAIDLMKQAYSKADPAKRQALFDAYHDLMLDQVPGIFLYDGTDVWGVSKKIHGRPVWQASPRLWEVTLDD